MTDELETEVARLRAENQKLRAEVMRLREEVRKYLGAPESAKADEIEWGYRRGDLDDDLGVE